MHRTNIYLSDEQCAALDRLARERQTTRSELVRDFVDRGLAVELDGGDRVTRVLAVLAATAGAAQVELPERGESTRERLAD